jgi:U32 family peptidase
VSEVSNNQAEECAASAAVFLRPELLAPAGDWECAKAAVENGADAIYFGLDRFNARMRAHNFTEGDLRRLMEFLHRRGVRGYVTFNTLIFANELPDAEQYLRSIIAAGVDAAIVQDVGIARLIRKLSPDFPIHASTQMTITSAAGVEFARKLGCNLVVLARECSLKDIEAIQKSFEIGASGCGSVQNPKSDIRNQKLPLEVFVHGALCVAYSGQCLTSEALGGRSANRGECAQACRMPYELVCDGKNVPLGDRKYVLSPQDLAGIEVLPELIRTGVASLKIEGRLKSAEYVANITRTYRQALDSTLNPQPSPLDSGRKYNLEMAFSRGLYTGWFRGINNQELVHARFGKKRGVYLGEVTRVERERVFMRLEAPLKPGDGVVFDNGHPESEEEGGRVFGVKRAAGIPLARSNNPKWQSRSAVNGSPDETVVSFAAGAINFSRVHVGDKVWKTSDPELDRQLRQTFAGDKPQFQRPIFMEVHGHTGAPLTIVARDELGNVMQAVSQMLLTSARKQPLNSETLREQLGRLGGTPFRLGDLKSFVEGEVILPVSELNRLRRDIATELERLRMQPKRWRLNDFKFDISDFKSSVTDSSALELIVLVRSMAQLDAALGCGVRTIYCEFENPKKYREAVLFFRERAAASHRSTVASRPPTIWVAPPRITKPGEEWILKQVSSCEADGFLIRNYDHLEFFRDCRRRGDFSLNVSNPLTAEYLIENYGLERVTTSYDLNYEQLSALLRSVPSEWLEITIHQHMPMFHMEHCVFCAFLSKGTDYRNCGRPCDTHDVKLRDRVGMEHPLKADAGCRNTLFNARAQTGAEYVAKMIGLGARFFRIEFLNESPNEASQTIMMYRRLLGGEISGTQLWRELKLRNQLGVTRGQMERKEYAKS